MGIIILGVAALVFLFASMLGAIGLFVHARIRRSRGQGSWPLYLAIASGVGLALLTAGWSFMPSGTGAPTGEDYEAVLWAYSFFAAAPGAGGLAGILAILKRPTSAA